MISNLSYQDHRSNYINYQDHSHSSRSRIDPPIDRQYYQNLRRSRARTKQKKRKTISITHYQTRIQRLRATSLILRTIHLVAETTLMMVSEVLKRKPIKLVLIRIIDTLIKDILTIIKKIERFIFKRIETIRSSNPAQQLFEYYIYLILDPLANNISRPGDLVRVIVVVDLTPSFFLAYIRLFY